MAANLASRILHTRGIVRAPIPLFEHGFGWLFGGRFLLLEHTGRKSGRPRTVVLEVIGHPAPETYRVVSGLGRSAQWFRNVVRHPQVRVTVGRRRNADATAEVLSPAAGAAALADYATAHPAVWRTLSGVLVEHTLPGDENFASIPVVDFSLATTESHESEPSAVARRDGEASREQL